MDRTAKIILVAIAFGLWANVGVSPFRSGAAIAQSFELLRIRTDVSSINRSLSQIATGRCGNPKIC